jgi:hypothetical protein
MEQTGVAAASLEFGLIKLEFKKVVLERFLYLRDFALSTENS